MAGVDAVPPVDAKVLPAYTFLHRAVEIVVARQAQRLAGLEEDVVERVLRLGAIDAERAVGAMVGVAARAVPLGPLEVGQHALVVPAVEAKLAPAVVIQAVAAHVHHAVDRRRAPQHLAARPGDAAPVQMGLRLGLVAPVDRAHEVDEPRHQRDVDEGMTRLAAGLQQCHAGLGIGREPVGQHAAGGTAADHDEIMLVRHFSPCTETPRSLTRNSRQLERIPPSCGIKMPVRSW